MLSAVDRSTWARAAVMATVARGKATTTTRTAAIRRRTGSGERRARPRAGVACCRRCRRWSGSPGSRSWAASVAMTCTSRAPPAWRTTELTTDPRKSSATRDRLVDPSTSWVAFSARAAATRAGPTSAPTISTNRPPSSSRSSRLRARPSDPEPASTSSERTWTPDELRLGAHRHPGRPADEDGTAGRPGQRNHHPLLRLPLHGDAVALPVVVELVVHAIGDPQERQLAQGGEVAGAEVVAEGGVDPFGRVDVAVGQTAAQGLGGHVDQLDLVGGPYLAVGDRLALGDTGDLLDHVVERLEVLEVDCRNDVASGVEQLVDVLPALVMP